MRREALYPVLLLALAATGGCNRQPAATPQASPQVTPPATVPAKAEAAVITDNQGKAAPKAKFTDLADGSEKTVADFKGKPLLVNLWATWCVPCVKELPTLAALAAAEQGRLQIVALSQDMEGAKVVGPFLADKKIALHPYHDRDNAMMLALKEASLPVSILFDADGKEVWRLSGDLDWTGPKAKALLARGGA